MASLIFVYVITTIGLLSAPAMAASASSAAPLETYIVHVPARMKPSLFASHKQWHTSMISDAIGSSADIEERMLYSYENSLQGFAVRLTPQEAASVRQMEGVGTLFKDLPYHLQTTRTPSFLGLTPTSGIVAAAKGGEDVIVGVLDSGVWPERRSYSDEGLPPIPARWKGTCENSSTFDASLACNRKLIGARIFFKGYEATLNASINETIEFKSPRDSDGHGSHSSSTAAGSVVPYANLSGFAAGTASGVAPLSRLAIYKVCWLSGCFPSDVLAAMEVAISDGVDVLSLSIEGSATDYFEDPVAIGSFFAMSKGIVTACAAGNFGPYIGSVANNAPWIFTIAASSIDRDFVANAVLGNGKSYKGTSLFNSEGYEPEQIPLVYAGNAAVAGGDATLASVCGVRVLDPNVVKGKMVFCDNGGGIARVAKGAAVKAAGGAGMILGNNAASGEELVADTHALPASLVGHQAALAIKEYINSTSSPTAGLDFQGTELNIKPAPVMTAFSSRGPNPITPEILKPDITAPGLNILAAWTGAIGLPGDNNFVEFNIISGTSMSCPHVAGATALLKAARPTWSPAAIKSALMTSAVTVDNTGKTITDAVTGVAANPTVYGAGHIHPNAALNPGLIYDITQQDYVDFLCSIGYTESMLNVFLESDYDCSKAAISKPGDLNYPSFSAVYYQTQSSSYTTMLTRTVTNIGASNSIYTVSVVAPSYVNVSVKPTTLAFQILNEKLSYSVTLSAGMVSFSPEGPQEALSFGSITWSDGVHVVTSPISFLWIG